MALFLAAGALLLIVAVALVRQIRADARRDTLGLRAARAEIVGELHARVAFEPITFPSSATRRHV